MVARILDVSLEWGKTWLEIPDLIVSISNRLVFNQKYVKLINFVMSITYSFIIYYFTDILKTLAYWTSRSNNWLK